MVMKMKNIDYLTELQDKEIPDEIFLLYVVDNDNYHLKVLYDYRIYGKTCEKLFKLCQEDYELFSKTLSLIDQCSYITLEVVHINLNFEDPIPFLNKSSTNYPFDDVEVYLQGTKFINKYDQRIDDLLNEHKTIFPR